MLRPLIFINQAAYVCLVLERMEGLDFVDTGPKQQHEQRVLGLVLTLWLP